MLPPSIATDSAEPIVKPDLASAARVYDRIEHVNYEAAILCFGELKTKGAMHRLY
jgi:hypothetical protein